MCSSPGPSSRPCPHQRGWWGSVAYCIIGCIGVAWFINSCWDTEVRLHKVVLPISVEDVLLHIRNCCVTFQASNKGLVVHSIMEYVELQPAYVISNNTNVRRDLDGVRWHVGI